MRDIFAHWRDLDDARKARVDRGGHVERRRQNPRVGLAEVLGGRARAYC